MTNSFDSLRTIIQTEEVAGPDDTLALDSHNHCELLSHTHTHTSHIPVKLFCPIRLE